MIANSKTLDTLLRHPIATVLAIYVVLAVATSHPLATTPSEVLPASNNSLLSAWTTSWVAQALPATPSTLFAANMFHPDRAALLYNEPMIGVGFLAWPIWMVTGDVAATYNLTFVLTLVLSALSMFLLVREVLGSLAAATVAGVVFAFTTANYDSAARLQIVSSQWTPLLLFFLVRLWRQGRARDALGMSASAVMQGLSCQYYTLYLATLLVVLAPMLLLVRGDRELWGRRWRGMALSIVVAFLLLVPLYAAQWEHLQSVQTEKPLRVGALPQTSYWNVLSGNWLYGGRIGLEHTSYDDRYFLGFVTLSLAGLGLVLAGSRRSGSLGPKDRYRWLAFLAAFGALAFLLGGGRFLPIPGAGDLPGPYAWLHEHVPGYQQTRVPSRFSMFVRLSVAVFAGLGAQLLTRRLALTRPWLPLGVLVFALPLEHLSTPLATYRLPVGSSEPEVYSWLESLPTATPILEYPMNPSRGRHWESLWTLQSARHWLPIVNGYGTNYPLAHYFIVDQLVTMFPNIDSLRLVRALGLRYVVFHPDYGRYPEVRHAARRFERRQAAYSGNLELIKEFGDRGVFDADLGTLGGERVYRVLPEEPPSVKVETDDWPRLELDRYGWRCETLSRHSGCEAAFDGRLDTYFTTRIFQTSGDLVRLRLSRPVRLRGVSIVTGRYSHEYPRRLELITETRGRRWRLADWNDLDSVEYLGDLLGSPERASMDYSFEPVEVTVLLVRIGQGVNDDGLHHVLHPWILPEIELLPAP